MRPFTPSVPAAVLADRLDGFLRTEASAGQGSPGGQQVRREYLGCLLGPGLAAVQVLPDPDAGVPEEIGKLLHALAPLLAQRAFGIDILGERQAVS